jgi:hypothetical protein
MLLDRQDLLRSTFVQPVLKQPAMATSMSVRTCEIPKHSKVGIPDAPAGPRPTGALAALMGAI